MIKINLSDLVHTKEGHVQTIALDLNEYTIGQLELKCLRGELRFTRVSHGIFVEGVLAAEVKTECTRCLTPFFEPITIELEDIVSLPGADLTPERPVRVAEGGRADLTPLIREYVFLALPTQPICTSDCKGICAKCGGNANLGECTCEDSTPTDPRWDALKTLLEHSE